MDSGFFASHGFDNEFDRNAFENTALNNMDPVREAKLFEEFEQDYRSGGYDPGPAPERYGRDRPAAGPTNGPTNGTAYPAANGYPADPGYREPTGSGYPPPSAEPGYPPTGPGYPPPDPAYPPTDPAVVLGPRDFERRPGQDAPQRRSGSDGHSAVADTAGGGWTDAGR